MQTPAALLLLFVGGLALAEEPEPNRTAIADRTFEGLAGEALRLENGEDVVVRDCRFRDVGVAKGVKCVLSERDRSALRAAGREGMGRGPEAERGIARQGARRRRRGCASPTTSNVAWRFRSRPKPRIDSFTASHLRRSSNATRVKG